MKRNGRRAPAYEGSSRAEVLLARTLARSRQCSSHCDWCRFEPREFEEDQHRGDQRDQSGEWQDLCAQLRSACSNESGKKPHRRDSGDSDENFDVQACTFCKSLYRDNLGPGCVTKPLRQRRFGAASKTAPLRSAPRAVPAATGVPPVGGPGRRGTSVSAETRVDISGLGEAPGIFQIE